MKLNRLAAIVTLGVVATGISASAANAAIPAPPAVPPPGASVTINPGARWIAPRINTSAVYTWAGQACRGITPSGTYLVAYGAAGKVVNPPRTGMPGTSAYAAICQYNTGQLKSIANVKYVSGSTGTIELAWYNSRPIMSGSTGTVQLRYHWYKQGIGGGLINDTIVVRQPTRAY